MARNVEIKARIESAGLLFKKAAALADRGPVELVQDDTFFDCRKGRLNADTALGECSRFFNHPSGDPWKSIVAAMEDRPRNFAAEHDGRRFPSTACGSRLKLRVLSSEDGELILYRRPDHKGPKECFYLVFRTTEPDALRECLKGALGEAGRVRKKRTLFLAGRTRIHLDQVADLGDFLELEVVLRDGESAESGEAVARDLMRKLDVRRDQLIEGAYADLLALKKAGGGGAFARGFEQ